MHTVFTIATMFAVAILALVLVIVAVRGTDRWVFPAVPFGEELRKNNLAVAVFLAALVFGIFFLVSHAVAAPLPARASRYDGQFHKWCRYEFGYQYDCRLFKAQGLTESRLDPTVCSGVGACGVMQLMPGTAVAMGVTDRFDAKQSIRAGIGYDHRVWAIFGSEQGMQRLWFAFGGFNGGPGVVIRAQARAKARGRPTDQWRGIARWLPAETRKYVPTIRNWHRRLLGWKAG